MRELAEILLRGLSTLKSSEREIIATFVSTLNDCYFCRASHRAAAANNDGCGYDLVDSVCEDFAEAPISEKLKALLRIAAKVQRGGKNVTTGDVAAARTQGATDQEVHGTVLIAAVFCMYNRYVDGLATVTPTNLDTYDQMGQRLATEGYLAAAEQPALAGR